MSHKSTVQQSTEALCVYAECRYCVHRVNASRTPNREGQCNLQLQGRASVSLCKGRLFFSVSPDRSEKYKRWVLSGSPREEVAEKHTTGV
ncbi:MAG: hypothetical protein M3Q29_18470 [Chloroflexota bacterium]|nr:hypothetical protein [Chloroflexota bacterium]